ncbi:hypothetical protein [Desulfolithobacter sp.]
MLQTAGIACQTAMEKWSFFSRLDGRPPAEEIARDRRLTGR